MLFGFVAQFKDHSNLRMNYAFFILLSIYSEEVHVNSHFLEMKNFTTELTPYLHCGL